MNIATLDKIDRIQIELFKYEKLKKNISTLVKMYENLESRDTIKIEIKEVLSDLNNLLKKCENK